MPRRFQVFVWHQPGKEIIAGIFSTGMIEVNM
jgi:hypothetical protein